MRVVYWGTYDKSKPRNRIMIRGLRENDVDVIECHIDIWNGLRDKSSVRGIVAWLRVAAKWICAYPRLLLRYMTMPAHDAVMVGYLGHLDVLIVRPAAWIRRTPVVWDAFISLYDTIVDDRKLISRTGVRQRLVHCWEWLACRSADVVVLDTAAHADYFRTSYGLDPRNVAHVYVGAEPEIFPMRTDTSEIAGSQTALFYGQMIPLHGVETIVEAASILKDRPVEWIIIGSGQEDTKVDSRIQSCSLTNVTRLKWVEYEALRKTLASAAVGLGIFGASAKAGRVIPNKVFQMLMSGVPVITRDSPAIRELPDARRHMRLVPADDPQALASAVEAALAERDRISTNDVADLRTSLSPKAVVEPLVDLLLALTAAPGAGSPRTRSADAVTGRST